MARRKQTPPVAKPTKRRRLIEWGKDALIVGLTCSALFLAWQTPLATQLRSWVTPSVSTPEPVTRQPKEAVEPYAIATRNSRGLYGAIYDSEQVDRAFERLSPLIGEGLSTAGEPQSMTRRQWQLALEQPGLYCAFQGTPSLNILARWQGTGGGLTANAQSLLLSWDGSRVWFCWREGSQYFHAPTEVNYEGYMDGILETFDPNGTAFAYTLAESDRAYAALDPDVLVSLTNPQPGQYTAASPDFSGDQEALEQLLAALDFQSGVGSAYEAADGLAINESGDRLRVSSDGTVVFHAAEEEARYPVAAVHEQITEEEAASAAWQLLNRATATWKGEETAYVLTGVEQTETGWVVTFHSRVEGIPLQLGEEGWTAQFTIDSEKISDFTLTIRQYTPTGETALLPGQRLAAAALGSESHRDSGKRLTLCYTDGSGNALAASWTAEE